MLSATTNKFNALEHFVKALNNIEKFKDLRDYHLLKEADDNLNIALKLDSNFYKPKLFKGILYDLNGKQEEAIDLLKELVNEVPEELKNEIRFNLGVAFFHRYSEEYVKESIFYFEKIKENETETEMLLLAKASLSQSYAMMILHDYSNKKDSNINYKKALDILDNITNELNSLNNLKVKNRIRGIINNSVGIAEMFYSDAKGEHDITLLRSAKNHFQKANKYSKNDWAVICNLGSIHMRIADYYSKYKNPIHFLKNRKSRYHFTKAINYLNNVLQNIRPEYDFAYFEIGRIYRLQGNFNKAEKNFKLAIKSEKNSRNIGLNKLNNQIKLCKDSNRLFHSF